eukprot:611112-Alexandrium_andersonii.AAC.1
MFDISCGQYARSATAPAKRTAGRNTQACPSPGPRKRRPNGAPFARTATRSFIEPHSLNQGRGNAALPNAPSHVHRSGGAPRQPEVYSRTWATTMLGGTPLLARPLAITERLIA